MRLADLQLDPDVAGRTGGGKRGANGDRFGMSHLTPEEFAERWQYETQARPAGCGDGEPAILPRESRTSGGQRRK